MTWFQSASNIAAFGRAVEDFASALSIGAGTAILTGLSTDNPEAVAFGYGMIDPMDAWETLDGSVFDQMLEFFVDPFGNVGGKPVSVR